MNDPLISLTPLGWAAVASQHLVEQFPALRAQDPEIQAILRPLFRQAVDVALERAYQGLLTQRKEPT